jgi:hypothetical protein
MTAFVLYRMQYEMLLPGRVAGLGRKWGRDVLGDRTRG